MYAIRDSEGRFVARSNSKSGAYRRTRSRAHLGASVNRVGGRKPEDGDYVVVGHTDSGGFSVSHPYAIEAMAIDEAMALSRSTSRGGEPRVGQLRGGRMVEIGRARDGVFTRSDGTVTMRALAVEKRRQANRTEGVAVNMAGGASVLARYLTKSGKVGLEVKRIGSSYSYIGEWGAGSLGSIGDVKDAVRSALRRRKGWRLEFASPEWSDSANRAGGGVIASTAAPPVVM